MTILDCFFMSGAVFLGWSLGKNNLSNLFGSAIGTRMIRLKTAALLASLFIFLGVFLSGYATTSHVNQLAVVNSFQEAFFVCVSAGLVIYILSLLGIPASITQTSTGALISLNVFHHLSVDNHLVLKSFLGWVATPFLSGLLAFALFYFLKKLLKKHPIKLLYRDVVIRLLLIIVGSFCAYSLGANNIASIAGPFISVDKKMTPLLFFLTALGVSIGFLGADKRVIKTVSKGMFPLSPMEAFIVVFSSALTLFCFSSSALKNFLEALSLPSFPLIPVPLSEAIIGSIIAIALSKGIDGLKLKVAGLVFCSWGVAPLSAGLLCYVFMYFAKNFGVLL